MKKIIVLLSIFLIVGLIVYFGVAYPHRSVGDCMEPAIKSGQLCFVNHLLPYFRKYRVNDIVTFHHEDKIWYSRVVALENNTIQITDGSVILNGKKLDDSSVKRDWEGWKLGSYAVGEPFGVQANYLFVLSDNLSADHDDSRVFGPISHASITGILR